MQSWDILIRIKKFAKRSFRYHAKPIIGVILLIGILVPILSILANLIIVAFSPKTSISADIFTSAALMLGICNYYFVIASF